MHTHLPFPGAGLLPPGTNNDLERGREHSPLLFDLALKRLLSWQGRTLFAAIFKTRHFLQRTSR